MLGSPRADRPRGSLEVNQTPGKARTRLVRRGARKRVRAAGSTPGMQAWAGPDPQVTHGDAAPAQRPRAVAARSSPSRRSERFTFGVFRRYRSLAGADVFPRGLPTRGARPIEVVPLREALSRRWEDDRHFVLYTAYKPYRINNAALGKVRAEVRLLALDVNNHDDAPDWMEGRAREDRRAPRRASGGLHPLDQARMARALRAAPLPYSFRGRQGELRAAFASRASSVALRSANTGLSTRSCGGYPHKQSSENTARSAPRFFASQANSIIRAELPAKSPTVGLNWANAIFTAP